MDDYTWRKRAYERRRGKQKELFLLKIFLVFLLAAGSVLWYYFFHMRSPEYALSEIQAAFEEGDDERFAHYVNLPLLTSKAYDDLTRDLFAYDDSLTPQTKLLFEKFYQLIKPQLTDGTADLIRTRIKSGAWAEPAGADILKGRQLGIDYERFLMQAQLKNTSLVSVGEVEENGASADAPITVRDDSTGTEFTLVLDMEQAEDGRWQVAYIRNYRDYLDAVMPRQNEDIASYLEATRDIVDSYNAKAKRMQVNFILLTDTKDGKLSEKRIDEIDILVSGEVIPAIHAYQNRLDAVSVPDGAKAIADLRRSSNTAAIMAWQHFITGLKTDDHSELETAETLHKRSMEYDYRVSDIARHAAVSKNLPNIP